MTCPVNLLLGIFINPVKVTAEEHSKLSIQYSIRYFITYFLTLVKII